MSIIGKSLDPALVDGAHGTVFMTWAAYDRLIALDADAKVIPYLASSWTVTPTSVTFTIRKGATCVDGTPVTPTVVANSLKRLVSEEIAKASPTVAWGRYFLGALPPPYTIVTADEATGTVTFTEAQPNSELLYGFLWPQTGVVCPAGFDPSADFTSKSYGSGPYTIVSRGADEVVLKRRPDWSWGPAGRTNSHPGVPDTITGKSITNETTTANLLLTGGLDLAYVLGPDIPRLIDDKSLTLTNAYSHISTYIYTNEDPSHPTSDKRVREAIFTAIDPQGWNTGAAGGRFRPATGVFMPTTRCYEDTSKLLPGPLGDTNKARSILLAAGYTAGLDGKLQKDGRPLSLIVLGDTRQNAGPEYVGAQLTKMGATVSVKVLANSTPESLVGNFDVQASNIGFATPIPGLAPSNFDGILPPTLGSNNSRTTDTVLIDFMKKGRTTLDCDPWVQWQRRVIDERHALPTGAIEYAYFGRGLEPVTIFGSHVDPTTIRRKLK